MSMYITLVMLAPVLTGLLWFVLARRDRRRNAIQNRLNALSAGKPVADTGPGLRLKLQHPEFLDVFIPPEIRDRLAAVFATTGNSIGVPHLLIAGLVAAILSFVFVSRVLVFNFGWSILAMLVMAGIAPFFVLFIARSRYQQRFLNVFPDALDLVRRGVKAGLPVTESLHSAAREIPDPVGKELRSAFEQVQLGVPMIEALEKVANRNRIPDFQFMVVALALQEKTGGSLAETLGNLSAVIRARKALRLKARSLSAEAKMSAFVLALLPFFIGGAMWVLNRDLGRMLFIDPRGVYMLGIAFLSLASGLITMYVIVKRALR